MLDTMCWEGVCWLVPELVKMVGDTLADGLIVSGFWVTMRWLLKKEIGKKLKPNVGNCAHHWLKTGLFFR